MVGHIYPGHEHRLTVILQGPKLSGQVGDTDPGGEAIVQRCLEPEALDDTPEAARTVALKTLLNKAQEVLKNHPLNDERSARGLYRANCIITAGCCTGG